MSSGKVAPGALPGWLTLVGQVGQQQCSCLGFKGYHPLS